MKFSTIEVFLFAPRPFVLQTLRVNRPCVLVLVSERASTLSHAVVVVVATVSLRPSEPPGAPAEVQRQEEGSGEGGGGGDGGAEEGGVGGGPKQRQVAGEGREALSSSVHRRPPHRVESDGEREEPAARQEDTDETAAGHQDHVPGESQNVFRLEVRKLTVFSPLHCQFVRCSLSGDGGGVGEGEQRGRRQGKRAHEGAAEGGGGGGGVAPDGEGAGVVGGRGRVQEDHRKNLKKEGK